ncbi:MAG: RNA pseudouridine synthase [Planctomycetota bacterium]|nr:RNA pseudouridine synthase [Planctomycetota bacterium]
MSDNQPLSQPEIREPLSILLEDGPLLAVNKPAGLLTLGAIPGIATLERRVKAYLKDKYQKAGNVYLGIPHRLDRPVSGVVVFARNSKCAARLAEQFRDRVVRKVYWAIVEGNVEPASGELVDWLQKSDDQAHVSVVNEGIAGAREARLRYRTLRTEIAHPVTGERCTQLEIELDTGRMHQIRVQFGSRGWAILGDRQYGSNLEFETISALDPRESAIALHARRLTLNHPVRYDEVKLVAPLPANWNAFPIPDEE